MSISKFLITVDTIDPKKDSIDLYVDEKFSRL